MKRIHVSHRNQTGFTLVELLLYIAILGSLLLVVSFFFTSTVTSRVKNQAESNVNQQAAFIIETMTQTIRNSDSITAPTPNNTTASLTLAVPTAAKSPTIFEVSGTTLQIREGATAGVALTSPSVAISNVNFENTSRAGTPGSIQISFTLSAVTGSNVSADFAYQRTFTASATVRQ